MEFGSTQSLLIIGTFAAVLIVIAFDLLDMAVTALLGLCFLLVTGALDHHDLSNAVGSGGAALVLLAGSMIVARVLSPTGIFDLAEHYFLRAVRGSGKRYLIGLMLMIAPISAFLPNATAVILTAPIIIRLARALEVDFVTPVILCALVDNTAGLLTLVGDDATFVAGTSIGLSFNHYLEVASLGGLVSVLAIVPVLPLVAREIWRTQRPIPERTPPPHLERPWMLVLSLGVLALMIGLFLTGSLLPVEVVPPAAAILCAALALLLVNSTRFEKVEAVLADVDWTTLIFLACLFCLIEAMSKTGMFNGLSRYLFAGFGSDLVVVSMVIFVVTFAISTLVANIPLVLAMTLVVKGYFVVGGFLPERALHTGFGAWPAWTLPVFIAMTFGTTLGGGATMVGDSSNMVATGICALTGERVTFGRFLRIGVPISLAQFVVAGVYVLAFAWLR